MKAVYVTGNQPITTSYLRYLKNGIYKKYNLLRKLNTDQTEVDFHSTRSINLNNLSFCNEIYLLANWRSSECCMFEYKTAKFLGLTIREEVVETVIDILAENSKDDNGVRKQLVKQYICYFLVRKYGMTSQVAGSILNLTYSSVLKNIYIVENAFAENDVLYFKVISKVKQTLDEFNCGVLIQNNQKKKSKLING